MRCIKLFAISVLKTEQIIGTLQAFSLQLYENKPMDPIVFVICKNNKSEIGN